MPNHKIARQGFVVEEWWAAAFDRAADAGTVESPLRGVERDTVERVFEIQHECGDFFADVQVAAKEGQIKSVIERPWEHLTLGELDRVVDAVGA